MGTRRSLAAAAALAALAALAAGTAGASRSAGAGATVGAGFATLRPGDTIAVKGAALGCRVTGGGVACFPTTATAKGGAVFAVLLEWPGIARIRKVPAGGGFTDVALRRFSGATTGVRPPSTASGATTTVRLGTGEVARLVSPALRWALDCAVVTSSSLPTLYCSLDDDTGPVPGTVAIVLNARQAALGRIETTRSTTVTDLRAQPR